MDVLKISRLIACGLLLLALADLPHGYYSFLRIVITIIAGLNTFILLDGGNKILFYIFISIAILFNPFIPIYLNKATWAPIDVLAGLFFLVTVFLKTTDDNDKNLVKK